MPNDHPTTSGDPAAEKKARQREYNRQWRARNREKIAAYNKQWNETNRKAWYEANAEYRTRQRAHERARKEADPEAFKAAQAARMQAWRKRHPEKATHAYKVHGAAYRKRHAATLKAKKQSYYRRNKLKLSDRQKCIKYGLTPERLAEMRRACKGRCPHCKVPFSDVLNERENVDHCHATGRVRGLICNRCNLLLGLAGDNPRVLRSLARYLERSKGDTLESGRRSAS